MNYITKSVGVISTWLVVHHGDSFTTTVQDIRYNGIINSSDWGPRSSQRVSLIVSSALGVDPFASPPLCVKPIRTDVKSPLINFLDRYGLERESGLRTASISPPVGPELSSHLSVGAWVGQWQLGSSMSWDRAILRFGWSQSGSFPPRTTVEYMGAALQPCPK